jgi:ATP-dependent RNA helicase DeaD
MAEIKKDGSPSFTELKINPSIIKILEADSITVPTPIQQEIIPLIMNGESLIAVSETGTGKTLAYVLPILQRIDLSIINNQVIILAPTHELASQINGVINDLSRAAGLGIKSLLTIGGASIIRQKDALKKKPQIIVGSPGRIKDLIAQKKIKTHTIKSVIVDEADLMITGDHTKTIGEIIDSTPSEGQFIFVSATIGETARSFIKLKLPEIIDIFQDQSTVLSQDITHFQVHVPDKRDKLMMLRKILFALNPERTIIFVRTNADAKDLAKRMVHHDIQATSLYGEMDKKNRQSVINNFKKGKDKILVCSDIAARGLDVKDVTHIINYNTPASPGDYQHRVGRTGRNGKKGIAVTLTTENEESRIKHFEKDLCIKITQKKLRKGNFI